MAYGRFYNVQINKVFSSRQNDHHHNPITEHHRAVMEKSEIKLWHWNGPVDEHIRTELPYNPTVFIHFLSSTHLENILLSPRTFWARQHCKCFMLLTEIAGNTMMTWRVGPGWEHAVHVEVEFSPKISDLLFFLSFDSLYRLFSWDSDNHVARQCRRIYNPQATMAVRPTGNLI